MRHAGSPLTVLAELDEHDSVGCIIGGGQAAKTESVFEVSDPAGMNHEEVKICW